MSCFCLLSVYGNCSGFYPTLAEAWAGLCAEAEPFDDIAGLVEFSDDGDVLRTWDNAP